MTEINFYVSSSTSNDAIYKLLPSLLERIVSQEHKVLIACNDEQEVNRLDKFLWECNAEKFIPHGTASQEHAEDQPILITNKDENLNLSDILICLSGKQVKDFSSYLKVIDIFEGSEEQKQAGRERWKDYKSKGYDLSYFTSENGKWMKKM
ncbi:MAG: DNA polymerase III subunit chi [Proteobacteria bacterium]|jgi:DNA polymerase-3 subunit chi|nr:MAG: DNA polymerase III subunit chi [Pseudomonadota bacterium]|tara:strand:+ start:2199 stop:2651 length:453 start_codon:yes stop_codon:yes gene_type:complete